MQTIALRPSLSPGSNDGAAPKGDTWIDIDVAHGEGQQWLSNQSGLDEQIISRLLEPAPANYWRRLGQGVHLHVKASVPGSGTSTIAPVDLGFWLEPGRIITVRQGPVHALERAAEACATGAGPGSSWELIVFVLSEGLSLVEQTLSDLAATIDQLEDEALSAGGDPPTRRVAELQKRLIYARRLRAPLLNIVSFISAQPDSILDRGLRDQFEEIANVLAQHHELLSLTIDRAGALQVQIRYQIADSMNAATYRFTWVATVFLPLSFLTGLLGINVAGIPGDHDPVAFWLVCGVLCVIAAAWGLLVGRTTGSHRRRGEPRDP
jgi:zinc transporter